MGMVLTLEQKEAMKLTDHDRVLEPLESSLIENTSNGAMEEYLIRSRHTMELIRQRADRVDVPLDAKLFQHLHLEATNLFYLTLKQPHDKDGETVNAALNRLVASVWATKVILAEETIKKMMAG